MKYKLITVDGKITYRQRMSLKQMQKFVGGYIEFIKFSMTANSFYVNEKGLSLRLPKNKKYSMFVGNIIMLKEEK